MFTGKRLPIDGDLFFPYFDAFAPMMPSKQAWPADAASREKACFPAQ